MFQFSPCYLICNARGWLGNWAVIMLKMHVSSVCLCIGTQHAFAIMFWVFLFLALSFWFLFLFFLEAVTVTLYAYAVVLSHIIGCQG
jgi:hypothetical protein